MRSVRVIRQQYNTEIFYQAITPMIIITLDNNLIKFNLINFKSILIN